MSSKSIVIKQSIKYFLIMVVFLFGISIIRLLWKVEPIVYWWMLGITGGIITIAVVLDILTINDVIPIFKK